MKGLRLSGGFPSPSSPRTPRTESSRPATPPAPSPQASSSSKPSARPSGRNDGFAASTSQASATQAPARPPPEGKDVTTSFTSNPTPVQNSWGSGRERLVTERDRQLADGRLESVIGHRKRSITPSKLSICW